MSLVVALFTTWGKLGPQFNLEPMQAAYVCFVRPSFFCFEIFAWAFALAILYVSLFLCQMRFVCLLQMLVDLGLQTYQQEFEQHFLAKAGEFYQARI